MGFESAADGESVHNKGHDAKVSEDEIDGSRTRSSSRVIPRLDALGRLAGLHIAPGTIESATGPEELARKILRAVRNAQNTHTLSCRKENLS